jgi:hypothetical protein
MKKEVIIAICIGLGLGLVVTYGIYRAKTSLNSIRQAASTVSDAASPTPSGALHNSLTLLSPQDESVQTTTDAKVTGTTDPEAFVIILLNDLQPQVIQADKSGNFSLQIALQQGSNVVVVRALDEDNNSVEAQRTVIVSTASLEEPATASTSAQTSTTTSPSPSPSTKPTVKPSPSATTK